MFWTFTGHGKWDFISNPSLLGNKLIDLTVLLNKSVVSWWHLLHVAITGNYKEKQGPVQ